MYNHVFILITVCYNVDRTFSPLVHLNNDKRELFFVYILGLINDSFVQTRAHGNPSRPPESRGEKKDTAGKERLREGEKNEKRRKMGNLSNPPKIGKLVNS